MKMGKRMRFGLRWLALCSMVVLFAGCSQQSQHGAKASKAAKIVLYSNSLPSGRGAWLKKEAAKAGFNITPVSLGGGDVINRLVSEKNKPVADVVYESSQFGFTKLQQEGILKKFDVNWKNDVPAGDNQGVGKPKADSKKAGTT